MFAQEANIVLIIRDNSTNPLAQDSNKLITLPIECQNAAGNEINSYKVCSVFFFQIFTENTFGIGHTFSIMCSVY